jgi:hypothetical protein
MELKMENKDHTGIELIPIWNSSDYFSFKIFEGDDYLDQIHRNGFIADKYFYETVENEDCFEISIFDRRTPRESKIEEHDIIQPCLIDVWAPDRMFLFYCDSQKAKLDCLSNILIMLNNYVSFGKS